MAFGKFFKWLRERRLSIRTKLILSLSSIAAILLVSLLISVMEYSGMSNYVSDLIADDISSINVANRLADMSNTYNLQILEVIGDETSLRVPAFDDEYFKSHCDSLRSSVPSNQVKPLADSVMYSYSAYMLTSLELEDVLQSDFIDSRSWYFERLQPRYDRLRTDLNSLSEAIYQDLAKNSATFEGGFYRSIIPGIVAVGVGLLLVVMLLFFLLAFYVNPLYRMLDGLNAYRSQDKKYSVKFDGDDQLTQLNEGISELANENRQFRSRIKTIGKK
jgi:predicted PurR-regulated permease PerM